MLFRTASPEAAARARGLRLSVAAVLLALAACGQKGPLTLPGHSKDTPWPLPPGDVARPPSSAPGADAPDSKEGADAPASGADAPASAPARDARDPQNARP